MPLEDACAAVVAELDATEIVGDIDLRTDVGTLSLILASLADNAITHGATTTTTRSVIGPGIEGVFAIGFRPPRAVYFLVSDDGRASTRASCPGVFEKFEKKSAICGRFLSEDSGPQELSSEEPRQADRAQCRRRKDR